MARRLLVVATAPDPKDELSERVRRYSGEDVEVLVVAPKTDVSLLQWLASDSDQAREEAERRAEQAEEAAQAASVRVRDAVVGDVDPLLAIEDALRTFPADELIVVTRPDEDETWFERDVRGALKRFGLPVTHLVDDDVDLQADRKGAPSKVEQVAHEVARGETPRSVFLTQSVVLLVIAVVAAVLIAIAVTLYVTFS
jgi:hypothetical protein